MYHFIRPHSEQQQDFYFGFPATRKSWRNRGTYRNAPAEPPFVEYRPLEGGWWQGDMKLRNFRPNKYLTRPHDGKRAGTMGRLKDALTGRGPDVFVTLSGDKRTLMRDVPQKWQWTGEDFPVFEMWDRAKFDKDHRHQDMMGVHNMGWTEHREAKKDYNFRTRKFERPNWRWNHPDHFWADAIWPPGVKNSNRSPLAKKDESGVWQTKVPWYAGCWPGGRPYPPWLRWT